jgi:hypothetical protein
MTFSDDLVNWEATQYAKGEARIWTEVLNHEDESSLN